MQLLVPNKRQYHSAPAASNFEGVYLVYVAKTSIADPKGADLHLKYVGKADKSTKSRIDAHGRGMF